MSWQYSLLFLFLSGFAALYVAEICKTDLLEGTSCTIKLPTKNTDKSNEITWLHLSSDAVIHRKNGKIKKPIPGLTMEEDGSLTFGSVSLKNTGKYKYTVFNRDGTEIDAGEKEIKVYAKAPKPTLTINYKDGISTLTCDFREHPDLTVSWYKEEIIIQNENNPELLLTSAQVQENKTYSCSVSNPVSNEQSNSVTVSFAEICKTDLLEGTSCTFELKTKNTDKSNEIIWVHLSSDALIQWKNGKIKKSTPGLTMEEDGSLTFESVSLKNSGKYKYNVYNSDGTEIDAGEKEITVYAKAPIPTLTVNINCTDGISTLTCDFTDRPDLTVSWYKEENIIQNKNNPKLLLTSAHIQENKPYSCSVRNPVSNEQSNSVTVSCPTGKGDPGPTVESGSGPTVESGPGPRTFFGFDFWVMVGILPTQHQKVVPNSPEIVAPDVPSPVIHEVRILKKGSSLLEDLLTFGPDLGVSVGGLTTRFFDLRWWDLG
ncbi:carcinoembryonic antigen-related cell adhesion molecule 5-like [Cyprinus carpio]|uniref:Carcinoembryonic antigen-related cell adhesion molecule 5-like n=1 Tax=Cyprinus carpio TaxID=7962 RepID=A0A9Q9VWB7_CYPCA|nr:carcinoembryonic antigen-related cell adhesion molecule 5-like [Cyprinus carpio]